MALLSLENRLLYSASVQRNWTQHAFSAYSLANAPRAVFNGVAQDYGSGTFYLYHFGDTDTATVHYWVTGSVTFSINGTDYGVSAGEGTFTVTGLTPHTVYTVNSSRGSSSTRILWLAFQSAISSTQFPAFTDGTVPSRADFDNAFQSLSEVDAAANMLSLPHSFSWLNTLNGEWRDVWRGAFFAGHDTLIIKYKVSDYGGLDFEVLVNGQSVAYHGRSEGSERTETIDLTALNIAPGSLAELQVRAKKTSGESQIQINNLYTYTTPANPIVPNAEMRAGDNVTASQLQNIKAAVDYCHPINGSVPLIREFPAMRINSLGAESWTPTDYYYIKHRNRFLRYEVFSNSGTPQVTFSGANNDIDLDASAGAHVLDLSEVADLGFGEYYKVLNCKYAFEDVTDG